MFRRAYDNAIALGAIGGSAADRLTWVQVVCVDPERVIEWSGRTTVEDVATSGEQPLDDVSFRHLGRRWVVDTGSRSASARYADRGFDLAPWGAPFGEIIYDEPSHLPGISAWIEAQPERPIARVERDFFAEAYLFSLAAQARERLTTVRPIAKVSWQCLQCYGRRTPGAPIETLEHRYTHIAAQADPGTPSGLHRVLSRTFAGR